MGIRTKAGKSGEQETKYGTKDVVLAKIRGYPAWPGLIVDPDDAPAAVQKERPQSKKTTFYCVRFFPAGDYAWTVAKDMSKLQKHEVEAFINEPSKKNGELLQGYKVALDPEPWAEEKLVQAQEKADEEADAPVDQLDSDGEVVKSKSKKRKREGDSASAGKAKAKSKPKKSSEEAGSKKKATGIKTKKTGAKSKAMIESEDEGGPEGEAEHSTHSKKASAPVSKKAKREKASDDDALEGDEEAKKVREWRHKLQKAFLTPKAPPKADDMPQLDELLKSVEQYDGMTVEYLSFSKIGKVMRHIAALGDEKVPRNAEYNFLQRAQVLVDKWQGFINVKGKDDAEPGGKATNGDTVETDKSKMDVDESKAETAVNGDADASMAEA